MDAAMHGKRVMDKCVMLARWVDPSPRVRPRMDSWLIQSDRGMSRYLVRTCQRGRVETRLKPALSVSSRAFNASSWAARFKIAV